MDRISCLWGFWKHCTDICCVTGQRWACGHPPSQSWRVHPALRAAIQACRPAKLPGELARSGKMDSGAPQTQIPQPEIQVRGGQRRILCEDEDEVLHGVPGDQQGRQPALHLRQQLRWTRQAPEAAGGLPGAGLLQGRPVPVRRREAPTAVQVWSLFISQVNNPVDCHTINRWCQRTETCCSVPAQVQKKKTAP